MDIEQAARRAKELGLSARIRGGSTLYAYTSIDEAKGIPIYENGYILRKVEGNWCVYDGGQLPINEFESIEDAVNFTIKAVKSNN